MSAEKETKTMSNILPVERTQALSALIKATQSLIELTESEAQALAQNDMLRFSILQEEKKFLTKRYERLSQEFRARLEEFRGSDRGQLDRLESLQNLLGERTLNNNIAVSNIYDGAKQKTQNCLLSAQELGQKLHGAPASPNTQLQSEKGA